MEIYFHTLQKNFLKKSCFHPLKYHRLLLLVVFTFFTSLLIAQTANGRVTAGDIAVVGATVQVKGTQTTTQTDANGKFTINAPTNATLIITSVGYGREEIKVANRNTVNIQLQSASQQLGEVIVVGYGTQKKVNVTGSVAFVSGAEINKRIVTSPASLLQGKLPGLTVVENSGEPGNEGISLRIRGSAPFGAGTEPLVVIDGMPGNLTALNPNDIESISVLKDAASASIYGSRAANGVIVVTTKKGTEGKLQLEYNYNAGLTSPSRVFDMVTNSVEYMQMRNQAALRQGRSASELYKPEFIDLYRNPTDKAKYGNYDWQNILFNNVTTHNHYVSANGGRGGTRYNLGLGYVDQPGIMSGFEYKKYTTQFGLNSIINKRVSAGLNFNFTYGDRKYPQQGGGEQYLAALTQPPMFGPLASDGSGHYTNTNTSDPTGLFHNKNPVAVSDNVRTNDRNYMLTLNSNIKVNVLKNLIWETRGGVNVTFLKRNNFRPLIPQYDYYSGVQTAQNLDVGTVGLLVRDESSLNTILYSQLNYNKKFGDHAVTLLGGVQQEYTKWENMEGYRRGFLGNQLRELNAGGADGQTVTGGAIDLALRSGYGRFNYDYKEKYLFEANGRYDGSSRFPTGQQWAFYPSVSAGWRMSKESFMKEINWITELKLRGSWGQLGNQNIGNNGLSNTNFYPYQDLLSTSLNYSFPIDNSGLATGAARTNLVPADLQGSFLRWETSQIFDLGLDASLFNNKLTITYDLFDKRTIDIIRGAQVARYIGFNAPSINNGTMQNKGWELSVAYNNKLGNFTYGATATYQQLTNKLLKFGAPQINSTTINKEGLPYQTFYLLEWAGIFQSQDEIDKSPKQQFNPKPGDLKFKDQNNDGKIDADDRIPVSGAYQKFNYSFNLNVGYKNFDFSAFVYGVEGQKQFVQSFGAEPFTQNAAPTKAWRNAWTPENHSNTMPALYIQGYAPVSTPVSTYFLQDASFLRIKSVQLSYNVPQKLSRKAGISEAKIYVAGDNLFVFTNYLDLDPERSPAINAGSRLINYPQNKIISVGARVKF